ncbi:phenylacetate--CoA ligase family protein [Saccharothrix obliqua]|uniref:phenylacetate--CoA ligase family protein n=1 Tax=Saccharothrix obliqua TaxID=2861747 RepID=UPI001C5D1A99|nr:AMP-binding protein [Saccharothrix obliqua]MBW4721479.1 AMP-binding protein [Saccharothrix obliqua]
MLLLRDEGELARGRGLQLVHTELVRDVFAGRADLRALYARKLVSALSAALASPMYERVIPAEVRAALGAGAAVDPAAVLDDVFGRLPFLGKRELSDHGRKAFTRELSEFLHYYESSGTTGHPAAAPKAVDDLVVNTINIGEMWGRLIQPADVALILINAPFAPAAYQFEKIMEYLGVMSFRPWVDNITGDYTRVLRLVGELGATVFIGPPSRLLEMVQFAHRAGLPAPKFERLLLMAEQTGPMLLAHLERLTGARAYVGSYGSSEAGTVAVTCEHRSLHLQVQSYLLELVDERGARPVTGARDRGELVVTTLDIPARPLIRYRTGDLVEVDDAPCACGLALPVLRTLGRTQDLLVLEGNGVRQNDVEDALWTEELPGGAVFNYMLVVRGKQVVVLVTTDGSGEARWSDALARRIAPLFPGHEVSVRPVDTLPPLAALGQYLGWKLSRVLDLDDERNWDRLPEPIRSVVRRSLDQVG